MKTIWLIQQFWGLCGKADCARLHTEALRNGSTSEKKIWNQGQAVDQTATFIYINFKKPECSAEHTRPNCTVQSGGWGGRDPSLRKKKTGKRWRPVMFKRLTRGADGSWRQVNRYGHASNVTIGMSVLICCYSDTTATKQHNPGEKSNSWTRFLLIRQINKELFCLSSATGIVFKKNWPWNFLYSIDKNCKAEYKEFRFRISIFICPWLVLILVQSVCIH